MNNEVLRLSNVMTGNDAPDQLLGVSFSLAYGEMICIAGRTYSGQRSLIQILSQHLRYQGSVVIQPENKELSTFSNQLESGIWKVGGRGLLQGDFSILDTICLSVKPQSFLSVVNVNEIEQEIIRALVKYGIYEIAEKDFSKLFDTLSAFQQNLYRLIRCCILKCKVTILHDFFVNCNNEETEVLLRLISKMMKSGHSFIYVYDESFDMMEPLISRIIVFRHGLVSYSFWKKEDGFDRDQLLIAMNGQIKPETISEEVVENSNQQVSKVEITSLNHDWRFKIKHPEVVGVTNSQLLSVETTDEFVKMMKNELQLKMDDQLVNISSMEDLIANHISVIFRNANKDVFLNLSPIENVTLISERAVSDVVYKPYLGRHIYQTMIDKYSYLSSLSKIMDRESCYHLPDEDLEKLSIAKWLSLSPKIVVYYAISNTVQPKEQEESKILFNQLKAEGKIVLVVSPSQVYLNAVCDRVISLEEKA